MDKRSIERAKAEAKRFLMKADDVLARAEGDKYTFITGNRDTGALRRASLDMTRALADMRKPQ